MSIPTQAVDRLFERLAASYGAQWTRQWADVPIAEVKTAWSHELGIFRDNLKAIGWALENLPDRCPNLIEFKNLCKQAPRPEVKLLDAPKADGEVVDKELAKIAAKAMEPPKNELGMVDHKRWAKTLKQRHDKGEKLNYQQIKMYQAAFE
jgi:hypothetical protein